MKGAYRKAGEGLFTRAGSVRTRGNSYKLEEGRFRLDIRKKLKKFFIVRMVRHWKRLPSEVVDASLPGGVQGQAGWGSERLMEL